jgi:hypothetical protein
MDHDTRIQSFSTGNVLLLSWRSIARRPLAMVAACLAAGLAASALPIAGVSMSAWFFEMWVHPLRRELIQTALAMTVVMPAFVLLLNSHAGRATNLGEVLGMSLRRILPVVLCQVMMDFIVVAPAYFLPMPVLALFTIYLIYEIPLLAFNYVFFGVMTVEAIGPLKGLRRTFGLLSGHWWRMIALALILWAASWVLIIALNLGGGAQRLEMWAQVVIATLSLGLRMMMVAPLAAASYHLLSLEKDGAPSDRAALVFD